MNNNIEELRKKIDALDDVIAKSAAERLEIAKEIGRIKAERGLPVRDAIREDEIIRRLTENVPGDEAKGLIADIYGGIFARSRSVESGKYGVVGGPALNSRSPFIHKYFGNDKYETYRVAPADLESFVAGCGLAGYNVTMPHKVNVMDYLDVISPEAEEIGAVNTVVVRGGIKTGYNTDSRGFRDALNYHGITVSGKKVCVLGSGGASKAICYACVKEGAREIVIVSRNGKINYENPEQYADSDVLVNCTPVGTGRGNAASPIDINVFDNLSAVYDLVYEPRLTRLVYEARRKGINAHGGLSMLIAQAAYSHKLFTGTYPGTEVLESLYRAMSPERTVLVGMPGAGKTELGRLIAACNNTSCVDTDELIEKETGMKIPDIFEKYGVTRFREIEKEVIKKLAADPPEVVSFGGGAVLDEENRYYIKSMGRVYWVVRDTAKLDTAGRPLSTDLKKLAEERYPIYESLRDVTIDNGGRISAAYTQYAAYSQYAAYTQYSAYTKYAEDFKRSR